MKRWVILNESRKHTPRKNIYEESVLEAKLADPALAHYRPWLRDLRVFRPHQMTDELEKISHERDLTANGAWVRLFDETVASLRFPFEGQQLTLEPLSIARVRSCRLQVGPQSCPDLSNETAVLPNGLVGGREF